MSEKEEEYELIPIEEYQKHSGGIRMQEIDHDFLSYKQFKILNFIKTHGPTHRSKIVNALRIPRTTVYDQLETLERGGYVKRFKKHNGKLGRPPIYWKLKNKNGVQKYTEAMQQK